MIRDQRLCELSAFERQGTLRQSGRHAQLRGNATTIDSDFYRASKFNESKVHQLAEALGANLTQPFPALSNVYRRQRRYPELQLDLNRRTILIATLADIVKSKR